MLKMYFVGNFMILASEGHSKYDLLILAFVMKLYQYFGQLVSE